MIWIEILGPSGVGKSYWYNKFMAKYPDLDPQGMVLKRIYQSDDYQNFSFKIKCMFFISNMNIYKFSNHFKLKLFSYFLHNFERKSKNIFTADDNILIKKYLANVDCLNEPQIVVLKKIDYFHSKLIEFKFYNFYLREEDTYIAEDGLLHLSPIFIEELKPNKLLVFEKDFEKLLCQRVQRARKNPTTFIEFLFNENDLKNYINKYFIIYKQKLNSTTGSVNKENICTINLDEDDVIKEMNLFVSRPIN